MNQKPSPLAALKGLTPEQADQLFELLRVSPYYAAVKWVGEQFGVRVSISSLRRWWSRETRARARSDLRSAIKASEQFDKDLDARALDARANNALRAAYWQAVSSGDREAIKTFASLSLDYNADARDTEKLERLLKAERDLEESRKQNAALAAELADLRLRLAEAGKVSVADPADVAAQLDRHLGVKK